MFPILFWEHVIVRIFGSASFFSASSLSLFELFQLQRLFEFLIRVLHLLVCFSFINLKLHRRVFPSVYINSERSMCCDEEPSGCCCGGEEPCNTVCKCCPYKSSPMLITAQCLSIFATILSFTWWVTFFLSLPSFIVLQVVWCCKMTKAGVIAVGVMSTLTFGLSIFAGAWITSNWFDYTYCPVWVLFNYDDEYNHYDDDRTMDRMLESYAVYCHEEGWAILAFFDA